MKSLFFLEKCGVMLTGQIHLSKGNYPFIVEKKIQHGHPEQCSSKFPDLVLTEKTISICNLTFRTGVFFGLSKLLTKLT